MMILRIIIVLVPCTLCLQAKLFILTSKKMSESQTKAGNQRKFENLKKFENF